MGHFWGYRTDEKNWEFLKSLTAEINRLTLVPLPVHPHPDQVCLAPFADSDKESYFRAQVLYVSGNSAEVCFSVVNLSNGNEADSQQLTESLLSFHVEIKYKIVTIREVVQSESPFPQWPEDSPRPGSPEERAGLGRPRLGSWPGLR